MITKSDITSNIIENIKKITDTTNDACKNDIINYIPARGDDIPKNLLSSLDLISLIVKLERQYNIEISDEELLAFATIDELSSIIYNKLF